MSPAARGRRAVLSPLSPHVLALSLLSSVSAGLIIPAQAAGPRGGGGHAGAAPKISTPPRHFVPAHHLRQPPVHAPVMVHKPPPVVHRPFVQHAGPQPRLSPAHNQPQQQPIWRPQGNLHTPFRPHAQQPQRRFAGPTGLYAPQVIYAPQAVAAYETPLVLSHAEPPLAHAHGHYGDHAPCAAPLIINIGAGVQDGHHGGMQVIHGQQSPCGVPVVLNYARPRIVEVGPAARPGKPLKALRARY